MSPQPATAPVATNRPPTPRALTSVAPVRRLPGAAGQPAAAAPARQIAAPGGADRFSLRQFNRGSVAPARPADGPAAAAPSAAQNAPAPAGSVGLAVDRSAWAAWLDGELLDLTYLEFEVLDFLVRHPGRVYSRAALLRHVWGHRVDDDPGQAGRTVDVLVTRLRRKLGPEHRGRIETVRRVGYRYRPARADVVA